MKKKIVTFFINVIIVIVVIQIASFWQTKDLLSTGTQAPDFNLESVNGQRVDLSSLKDKKVVLYFFSPWCRVCKYTTQSVIGLRKVRSDNEWEIIAVALSWSNKAEIEKYIKDNDLSIPVLLGNNRTAFEYKVDAFPSFYILGKNGIVSNSLVGYVSGIGLKLRTL